MSSSAAPRRRSCLAVPGSSERKLTKAAGLGADEIVIDLEDAVLPDAKDAARDATITALGAWSSSSIATVRVNAPGTPWCHVDLARLGGLAEQPVSVVVPKVEGPDDLAFVDRLLDGVEAASGRAVGLRVQALIETASGLAQVGEIAAASERLDGLVLGYADLGASLGGERGLDAWLPAQHAVVTAARAAGVQAIDGPFLGVDVDKAFAAAVDRARELGFDGKWAIHPRQVDALNEAFTPTSEEVERARAVLAALERAEQGAVALDGQMLDEAVAVSARRVLARAGTA
jgi:citrate lyase subunit beta/citryl-CoA lyase